MLTLRDIMTTDVITVGPDDTLQDAMQVLSAKHISGAPVVRHGKVLGVVSATDLMEFASGLRRIPGKRAYRESPVAWDEAEDLVQDDEAASAAWFTELWDNTEAEVVTQLDAAGETDWSALEEHTVADAMTQLPLRRLAPSTPVVAAADYMRRARIHRVLVMEGDNLAGIVSLTDIARAVADRMLVTRTFVFS